MPQRWEGDYNEDFREVVRCFERVHQVSLEALEWRLAWQCYKAGMDYVRMFGYPEEGVTKRGGE